MRWDTRAAWAQCPGPGTGPFFTCCPSVPGCSQAIPLVPLTEENEEAMENGQFQHLLRKLGIRPPSSGQAGVRARWCLQARDRPPPQGRQAELAQCQQGSLALSEHPCCPGLPCCPGSLFAGSYVRSLLSLSPLEPPFLNLWSSPQAAPSLSGALDRSVCSQPPGGVPVFPWPFHTHCLLPSI